MAIRLARSAKYVATIAGALMIVVTVGYLLFWSSYFKITTLEIRGAKNFVNPTDLRTMAENLCLAKNIFGYNSGKLSEVLMENFKGASAISVKKKFPGTIIVNVTERHPLALIVNTNKHDYYLVDNEGYVLGVADRQTTNLPEITYDGTIKVGEFINSDLIPVYLSLVAAIDTYKVDVSSMSFFPRYTQVFLRKGTEVLIGNDKSKTEALGIVKSLLKQLDVEGRKANRIDLRYDKVIVSF